ncbi:DUF4255 domain-containing protein [Leptothoe spongobia]|uniref:DUF4255 domain-containing protein n=1 Tax=Leptothoe spongobia TAU-MAC 1115 TaxID=1967444 RepID=A0A947DEQ0_9CYAN|nr:DUF4255 domain-containing protein [Leptothoe spongobia]MBT9314526.1 DUF4255 domain-containing protein [Leptothoe spongobia TAU-MAC 1115]
MSNSLAIAAVTTTLQSLINQGIRSAIDSATVTAVTLEKAQANGDSNRINLLLYHAMPKLELGHQQSLQPRGKVRTPQKTSVALDLYYLVAAYGENGSEAKSHLLLGRVIQFLSDGLTLGAAEIETATARELPNSDLHRQLEKIQISPVALTFEEMSKVWQVLQNPYRPSVALKVSVIMIDIGGPVGGAMPVLSRSGVGDGPFVMPGLPPMITGITLPHRQPSARVGDRVLVRGEHFAGDAVTVQLRHPLLAKPIDLVPQVPPSATSVETMLSPDSPWLAGFWTVAVGVLRASGSMRVSNEFPLAVAPIISGLDPLEVSAGNVSLSLTCVPAVRGDQRVMLIWGDRTIAVYEMSHPEDDPRASRLTFRIRELTPGVYPVRLRVDGVDSMPVDVSAVPMQVDPQQQVRITVP